MKEKNEVAVTPKKKKKKVIIIVLVIVAVLVAIIGKAVSSMTKQVEMVSNLVEVEPVQKRDLSDTISLKGTVAGESKTNVISLATAEVTEVSVQVGDIVAEGDSLVTLDREDIEEQIADLETVISNSEMLEKFNNEDLADALSGARQTQTQTLEDAKKAVDDAKNAYDQAEKKRTDTINSMIAAQQSAATEEERVKLVQETQDYVDSSAAELEALQDAIETAQTTYDRAVLSTNQSVESAAEAITRSQYTMDDSLDTARDNLDELRKQLEDCELKAPCGGVVVAVNVSVGDKNTPGQTLITIEDTSSLKMVATVEEADILKLQEGMTAVVTSDATGDEELSGTVTRVVRVKNQSASSDMSGTSGGYSVEISIDSTDLLIGMSTKAKVMIKDKGEALAVPYDLIQYDEDGNAFVLVAESNDDGTATAVRKNVEVGEEVDYYTEIIGGELAEGDMMIYDYSFSILEGDTFAPEQMYSNQDLGYDGAGMMDDGAVSVEVIE